MAGIATILRSSSKESALARLTSTFYKGETSKFNFEKYINAHKTAHKIFKDCNFINGSGLDDATKIQYFKSGIRPEAGLDVVLTTLRSNPTYRGFDHLVSFLSAEVDQKVIRGQQVSTASNKRVSPANTGCSVKPTSRSDKPNEFCVVDGKRVYRKSYPKQEFRSLSKPQCEQTHLTYNPLQVSARPRQDRLAILSPIIVRKNDSYDAANGYNFLLASCLHYLNRCCFVWNQGHATIVQDSLLRSLTLARVVIANVRNNCRRKS